MGFHSLRGRRTESIDPGEGLCSYMVRAGWVYRSFLSEGKSSEQIFKGLRVQ